MALADFVAELDALSDAAQQTFGSAADAACCRSVAPGADTFCNAAPQSAPSDRAAPSLRQLALNVARLEHAARR